MKTKALVLTCIFMTSIFAVVLVTAKGACADSTPQVRGSTIALTSGVSSYQSLTTTTTGKYDDFYITVGSIPTSIVAVLDSVGTDDFDLFYHYGSTATSSHYDLRAYTSSADETLTLTSTYLTTGTHYFRVQRYGGSGTDYYYFTVTVTSGGTSDTIAPTVSISSPSSGATVSGSVTVTATASDNVGVSSVEFYVDSTLVSTDTTSAYSYTWDTTAYSDGTHTIYAIAADAASNEGISTTISVTVSNGGTTDDGGALTSGVAATGNMDSTDGSDMWYIDVAASATSMQVVLECGTADFDSYGKFGSEPTTSSYDWRGYTSGGEDNTITSPSQGRHYIMVDYYSGSGSYTLTATVTYGGGSSWGSGGKYAIIVGISNYQSISDLTYCDEDALDWYNFLTGKGYECHVYYDGSYTSNSFTSIPSANKLGYATESNIRAAIQELAAYAVSGNDVAFVTSGHGSGDGSGESYLCMYDCSGSAGCYYDHELAADFALFASGVQCFVFVDHCYSGGLGPEFIACTNNDYFYMTTTCTANGFGYDDSSYSNGAWTYYFLYYFSSSTSSPVESIFDSASAAYPYTGGDAPMEFDGFTSSSFYL